MWKAYSSLKTLMACAPNKPLQLTPLRVDKIGAILRVGISKKGFSIYGGGAAEWQAVSPLPLNLVPDEMSG